MTASKLQDAHKAAATKYGSRPSVDEWQAMVGMVTAIADDLPCRPS